MTSALDPALCRAHVYVSNIVDPYKPVWVEIDGFEPAHTLVNHDSDYLLIVLTPGSHELEISIDFLSNVFSETIIVNCDQDRAFYLSVLIEDSDIAFTKLENEIEGRKQIDKREPHLVADQD